VITPAASGGCGKQRRTLAVNNPRALREVILEIGHVRLELITLEGVFSSKRLDPGSLTLLRNLPA